MLFFNNFELLFAFFVSQPCSCFAEQTFYEIILPEVVRVRFKPVKVAETQNMCSIWFNGMLHAQ